MESDLRQCRNKRCSRYQVLVVGGNHCTSCGRKMGLGYGPNGHQPGQFDTPPLIDYPGGPRPAGNFTVRDMRRTLPEPTRGNDVFTADDCYVKGCPIPPKSPAVEVPLDMYHQWQFLAQRFKTEWIAYLKGERMGTEGGGDWRITGFYFPKQKANKGHVDAMDGEIQEGTIGSVHSHNTMNAFFSAEDEQHFNHPVEMVINAAGDIKANVQVTLECGRASRKETKVMLVGCDAELGLQQQLKEKLTEEQPAAEGGSHVWTGEHYHGHQV